MTIQEHEYVVHKENLIEVIILRIMWNLRFVGLVFSCNAIVIVAKVFMI